MNQTYLSNKNNNLVYNTTCDMASGFFLLLADFALLIEALKNLEFCSCMSSFHQLWQDIYVDSGYKAEFQTRK